MKTNIVDKGKGPKRFALKHTIFGSAPAGTVIREVAIEDVLALCKEQILRNGIDTALTGEDVIINREVFATRLV